MVHAIDLLATIVLSKSEIWFTNASLICGVYPCANGLMGGRLRRWGMVKWRYFRKAEDPRKELDRSILHRVSVVKVREEEKTRRAVVDLY